MLRKLGSYPRQNGLAVALRDWGRIERTLFSLDWMQNAELRRHVQIGWNKGKAKNALACAIFFYRLGEICDGHVQSMKPVDTNPNGARDDAQNLWNVTR